MDDNLDQSKTTLRRLHKVSEYPVLTIINQFLLDQKLPQGSNKLGFLKTFFR